LTSYPSRSRTAVKTLLRTSSGVSGMSVTSYGSDQSGAAYLPDPPAPPTGPEKERPRRVGGRSEAGSRTGVVVESEADGLVTPRRSSPPVG
jgi:hypothetical protein